PLRGLGQTFPGQAPHPFLFDWSNGDTTPSAAAATAGLQHNGELTGPTLGDGFSFTVPAGPATQILRVYVATNRADGTLTAHLSDGSAPDYTATLPQAVDQRSGVYTISYRAASANQTLTVTWVESAANCAAFNCDNAAIFAVALS